MDVRIRCQLRMLYFLEPGGITFRSMLAPFWEAWVFLGHLPASTAGAVDTLSSLKREVHVSEHWDQFSKPVVPVASVEADVFPGSHNLSLRANNEGQPGPKTPRPNGRPLALIF